MFPQLARFAIAPPVISALEGVYDFFQDPVTPLPGCVVYCDLILGYIEHSGIYLGNNRIAHLNKHGLIEAVTPKEFISGTTALNIYVSADPDYSWSLYSDKALEIAESRLGNRRDYSVLTNNCHQFTSSCITGNLNNNDLLLTALKATTHKHLGKVRWRKGEFGL